MYSNSDHGESSDAEPGTGAPEAGGPENFVAETSGPEEGTEMVIGVDTDGYFLGGGITSGIDIEGYNLGGSIASGASMLCYSQYDGSGLSFGGFSSSLVSVSTWRWDKDSMCGQCRLSHERCSCLKESLQSLSLLTSWKRR